MSDSHWPLIVAVLAVVVGPCVALLIARYQICASLKVADKQVIAPLRQAWIDKLRELLAELTANTVHGRVAGGVGHRTNEDNTRLFLLLGHIQLMLNPNEADHQRLEDLIRRIVGETKDEQGSHDKLSALQNELIALSRDILKREWNRVKEPIGK